jgi:hypothetical protein
MRMFYQRTRPHSTSTASKGISMKRAQRLALQATAGILVLVSCATSASAKDQTNRMNQVIDNLIASYNAVDSINYRRHFSAKLLVSAPLSEIGEALRSGNSEDGLGRVVSADREISASGDRALVVLHFEKNVFDMHLRLDKNRRLARDTWLPHKSGWDEVTTVTTQEIDSEREQYEDKVNQFAQAFIERDATKLVSLFPSVEDDPDARTLADHEQMVNRFEGRGEFVRVGDINYLGNGDVSIPLMMSDDEGYEFVVTFNSLAKIVGLRLTNWAPKESEGKSLADIGADSLRTVDLKDISQLADAFRAGSGKVRFVTLLSPT